MKNWLTAGLVLLAIASGSQVAGAGDVAAGKAVYTKKCAACHGAAGEGKESIAKALKVELRHLGSKEVQGKSDEQLRKDITEGTEKKKPVKGLSEQELADVIAYVRSLAKK